MLEFLGCTSFLTIIFFVCYCLSLLCAMSINCLITSPNLRSVSHSCQVAQLFQVKPYTISSHNSLVLHLHSTMTGRSGRKCCPSVEYVQSPPGTCVQEFESPQRLGDQRTSRKGPCYSLQPSPIGHGYPFLP